MNLQRWHALMSALALPGNDAQFQALEAAYAQKHRHYHCSTHIAECLRHLQSFATQAEHIHEIELALWFHDAIYSPLAGDNERRSAEWATRFLHSQGTAADVIARVHALIMVTRHDSATQTRDESILVDVDLAILGAPPRAYQEFEDAVRREYRMVPGFIFRKRRTQILDSFLRRPAIYVNEPFRSNRQDQARTNLAAAINRLTTRGGAC